jgi:hypothetical protein
VISGLTFGLTDMRLSPILKTNCVINILNWSTDDAAGKGDPPANPVSGGH